MHLGGVPLIADDMLRFVQSDLETFGVAVLLLIVGTLTFFFRRPRWACRSRPVPGHPLHARAPRHARLAGNGDFLELRRC